MSRAIRIGIVGTGKAARIHAAVFKKIKNVELYAIAGRDALKASSIAKEFSIKHHLQSIQALLDSPDIDAVVIAVPPFLQPNLAIRAFKNKKHVLCEKTLAVTAKDAQRVLAAQKTAKRVGMVNFCYRLIPQFEEFKSCLSKGMCGYLNYLSVEWVLSTRLDTSLTYHWKGERDQGGGVLQNFGVHLLDYLAHDKKNVRVVGARQAIYIHERLDEKGHKHSVHGDEATTALLDIDGTPTLMHLSLITDPARGFHMIARGSDGTLELKNETITSPGGPFSLWFHRGKAKPRCLSKGEAATGNSMHALFSRTDERFVEAILTKNFRIGPTIEDGVNACNIQSQIQAISNELMNI